MSDLRVPKIIHRIIKIGGAAPGPEPNVIRLRGAIDFNIKIGPFSLGQWEVLFRRSVNCRELQFLGFKHLDSILAVSEQKLRARGNDKMNAAGYLTQFVGITSRAAAEKLGKDIKELYSFCTAFIFVRRLIARANLQENLRTPEVLEEISGINKMLSGLNLDLLVLP